ncbi:hypothetical protein B7494_g89 [Chlorociboria aeruginascens]|nr:hypothetical protein B7494_g89 [Chlorociboria aeruginascens]
MDSCHSKDAPEIKQSKFAVPTNLGTPKTRRFSAYDNDFEQHLIDHNIYPERYKYPAGRLTPEPALDGLRHYLAQPRPSLSPSQWPDSNFKEFRQKKIKHPSGATDVAKRQACYDGALGARGMHQLQSYGQDQPIYDGNAYTITATYHDGNLNMYATHITRSADGALEYHMTHVDGWNALGNSSTFRQAFTAFQNGRDWAQEQRDAFISAANERARAANAEPPPFESFNHNDGLDPTAEQDAGHLTQAEDSLDNAFHPESSTFVSSDSSGLSDIANACPAKEFETSSDDLALDTYGTASSKRRVRASKKIVSKAARESNIRPKQRGSRDKFGSKNCARK